jgi:uncharacterized protein (UPF0548 family)
LTVLLVQPRNSTSIESILARARTTEPTFPNLGATLTENTPRGFRRMTKQVLLGRGDVVFDRASEGIRTWRSHELLGVRIYPTATSPTLNGTVVVTLGSRFASIAAPCRIIAVIDEPERIGFVYATLPGHPEQGEELFIVSIGDEGTVRFRISAISAPGDRLTRIAGPLGRAVQSVATSGYLRSMRRFVDPSGR